MRDCADRPFVIAVDGPSAAGKGTLARRLAAHYRLAYLDTGLLYRAVGATLLRAGQDPEDGVLAVAAAETVAVDALSAADLRDEAVAQAASKVAALPPVRAVLLELQRRFAFDPPTPGGKVNGAVLDGRDIGTIVCPEAQAKIFVTAGLEERAARRHRELIAGGRESIYSRVLQDMIERDARDSGRSVAPLVPARDALVLDSSALDPDAAFAAAVAFVDARRCGGAGRKAGPGAA